MDPSLLNAIESRFNNLSSNIRIPDSIDLRQSYLDSLDIVNDPNRTKEALISNIKSIARSIKITPLTYADERKFYTYVDAAYKVYQQLLEHHKKFSRSCAWLIANVALLNWYYRNLIGNTITGREVEKQVDLALRSPMYFLIMNCLMGLVKVVVSATTIYFGTAMLPEETSDKARLILFGYYIISMIINLIKISLKIYRAADTPLDPIKPSA